MTYPTRKDVDDLLCKLGYAQSSGYVDASGLDNIPSYRFAVSQALKEMNLLGVFGLWSNTKTLNETCGKSFRPLVYVTQAQELDGVREIHKRVWSQGLVPLLLVLTPDRVWSCKGFSYSSQEWAESAQSVTWKVCGGAALPQELRPYLAARLRSSLAWRDVATEIDLRTQRAQQIDSRLLQNLQTLSDIFIEGKHGLSSLPVQVANSLIGRFLYVYFLRDRGVIDNEWLRSRKHFRIDLESPDVEWPEQATWDFFDDLDSLFNGSIFPLTDAQRKLVKASHVLTLRRILRHNHDYSDTGEQLNFFDIYFPTIRTETLSAVYEQFLENEGPQKREDDGAFYTPPFIADYVLDQTEDTCVLQDGIKILDSAAGSGVFLVGAYRRIIERRLSELANVPALPAHELRALLVSNIFGVERNIAACQVAAFSLYLTFMDYLSDEDLRKIADGKSPEKLFPPLVGTNILDSDFFDPNPLPAKFPAKFNCIVGNPPWQKLSKLKSPHAELYRKEHLNEMPIDQGRASELFAWKCVTEHLLPNGTLGLLVNIKSLISPSARHFHRAFLSKFRLMGIANFSHFRYRLFLGARAPAAAIFVANDSPNSRDMVWTYSPTLASQPIDSKGWPWAIIVDNAAIYRYRYSEILSDQKGCFRSLMLRSIDRRIEGYLESLVEQKQVCKLGQLERLVGLQLGRGGSPAETGVDAKYLLGEDFLAQLGLEPTGLFGKKEYELPATQMRNASKAFRYRFGGWVLILTRHGKPVHLVKKPMAFSSTLFAINFKKPSAELTQGECNFLNALRIYLNTQFVQYAMAIYGHTWLLDGRRFDIEDTKSLPVPFQSLDDSRIDLILNSPKDSIEDTVLDILGIPTLLRGAIREFISIRKGFQDGKVPDAAISTPQSDDIGLYLDVLRDRLSSFVTNPKHAFVFDAHTEDALGLGTVVLSYVPQERLSETKKRMATMARDSLERYRKAGGSVFTDSLDLRYERESATVRLVKPLERYHWTIERAYSDSNQIFGAVAGGRSPVGEHV